ncbi:hypothetical protein RHGRI_029146 [Rhododendron griersonianum]|uniref:prolyl oligopeptidase n=1 Tax=Rhododendron griersonianum TaxID=479676 RepID=A0AAV6IMZ7_9ERIC|nr:hypothetical protein RHGRI_029146 [Rhododendron griersonianum]
MLASAASGPLKVLRTSTSACRSSYGQVEVVALVPPKTQSKSRCIALFRTLGVRHLYRTGFQSLALQSLDPTEGELGKFSLHRPVYSYLHMLVVRRLLCSARPVTIQTSVNPTASDQDLQQAQLSYGSLLKGLQLFLLAMGHLLTSTRSAEACVSWSFACPTKLRNILELKSWPEFHNAVAAGSHSGLRFAGTKNGDAQELLYDYAIYFLNEVQPPQFAAEVTAVILLQLKIVHVCGPRYWPQVIELVLEDKPWWSTRDKIDPFNSGVLYIKRKVGSCSYVDDPVGCQSLLSRAMHKVFGLTSLRACTPSTNDCVGAGAVTIDQLVSTFSSDPSLIAFAQLCCDPSWNSRQVRKSLVLLEGAVDTPAYGCIMLINGFDGDFQEFYLQVLFECVSKDRPALLQVGRTKERYYEGNFQLKLLRNLTAYEKISCAILPDAHKHITRPPAAVAFPKKVKFSGVSWTHDGKGFFIAATQLPSKDGENVDAGTETNVNLNQEVYYHFLGTNQSEDILCWRDPDNPKYTHGASVTDDGKYLLLTIAESCEPVNKVYYCDMSALSNGLEGHRGRKDLLPFVKLIDNFDADYDVIANDDTLFTFQTNKDAPKYKLVRVDLKEPSTWREILQEAEKDVLESAVAVNDNQVLVSYLSNVKREDIIAFIGFTSFLSPGIMYQCNLDTGIPDMKIFREIVVPEFDRTGFNVNQVFIPTKDGTQIPMFIAARKDILLDGSHPCLLYAYGGFNISITPSFSVSRIVLTKHLDTIFCRANIRGGGEYGEEWHKASSLAKKQNCFDDFISAAEFLVSAGYTQSRKLCIEGGSNGGLLIGACINQRPDLFGCALAHVGVMDIGHAWTSDFGCSEKEEFHWLIKLTSQVVLLAAMIVMENPKNGSGLFVDFPEDPSGRFDDFDHFVKSNFDICKWIGWLLVLAQVWEAALQAAKDEEAIKPRQCEDLNNLVQESSNTEFARLEELKRQIENFNSSRSSNSVPYEHYLPPEKLERLFAVSIKLLTENANLIKESYLDHYVRDFPGISKKFKMRMSFSVKIPPTLFRWLENCLQYGYNFSDSKDLPPLLRKDEGSVLSWAQKIIAFYSLLCGAKHSGKNLPSGVFCNSATGSSCNFEELAVLAMVGERFGLPVYHFLCDMFQSLTPPSLDPTEGELGE